MCRNSTTCVGAVVVCPAAAAGRKSVAWLLTAAGLFLAAWPLLAQSPGGTPGLEWRRIGSTSFDAQIAGEATGPVDRVWYGPDGRELFARLSGGRVYVTGDFETWVMAADAEAEPSDSNLAPGGGPSPGSFSLTVGRDPLRVYAFDRQVHRSDDGGLTWTCVTAVRNQSIIGAEFHDLAVSPADPDDVTVANDFGVWRSLDAGRSWRSMNQGLPNLPVRRIASLPAGAGALQIEVEGGPLLEWAPGERQVWRLADAGALRDKQIAKLALGAFTGSEVTALVRAGGAAYAGTADGRLYVSLNGGESWMLSRPGAGAAVRALYVYPDDPRLALAALEARAPGSPRVLRTTNQGQFWDDLSANLPPGPAYGVTADRESGSVYVATEGGIFYARADLANPGPATGWTRIGPETPGGRAVDVQLDPGGHRLYAAVEGYGVYAAMAPHRFRNPAVLRAADYENGPAAPGALLSVVGRRVDRAIAGGGAATVLAASGLESQIQLPFDLPGTSVTLALENAEGRFTLPVAVRNVSPGIVVDQDGSPLVLDGDTGILLDAMTPARAGTRLQILATGLGRVQPEWPAGLPAPLEDSPRVIAPVRVLLDREPLEVLGAALAPGYVGFYLVEAQIPVIVNAGPAELYLEADGQASNRVRLYLQP
jgi:uncharacterized protein (TIGR03437 family)